MRRTAYSNLRSQAALVCGLDPDNLPLKDAATLLAGINEGLQAGWEKWWFPEWTPVEQRQFRANYASATAYTAPTLAAATEVFYPLVQGYFQALKATTGNAPTNASGVTDTSRWYPCAADYNAPDWAASTAYTAGSTAGIEPSLVRHPDNGRFYACITGHTSSSSFDDTKFAVLTPFTRDIDYEQAELEPIGDVRAVWDADPLVTSHAEPIRFNLHDTGILVRGDQPIVWVEFRRRRPLLRGAEFDAADTYAVGEQVYFEDTDATSDFWQCVSATSAGESPTTHAAKWERLEVPYVLQDFLCQHALSHYLRGQGEAERAVIEYRIGQKLLDDAVLKIERAQSQNRTLNVRTRT